MKFLELLGSQLSFHFVSLLKRHTSCSRANACLPWTCFENSRSSLCAGWTNSVVVQSSEFRRYFSSCSRRRNNTVQKENSQSLAKRRNTCSHPPGHVHSAHCLRVHQRQRLPFDVRAEFQMHLNLERDFWKRRKQKRNQLLAQICVVMIVKEQEAVKADRTCAKNLTVIGNNLAVTCQRLPHNSQRAQKFQPPF